MTNEDQPPQDEALDEGLNPPQSIGEGSADPEPQPVDDSAPFYHDEEANPNEAPAEVKEDLPAVTELSSEERASLRSLLTVGKRTKRFDLFGFEVVLQTMNCDDEMLVGMFCKDYRDTDAWSRAYQLAVVSATVQSVGGESWTNTLQADPSPQQLFNQRIEKARKMYPLVINYIYNEYLKCEGEFAELARKLGKL